MAKDGQRHPSEYVRAPKHLIALGRVLEADLFIYMPLNQTFVRYRAAGTALTAEDMASLAKVPEGNLVIFRSEQNKLLARAKEHIVEEINTGNIESPLVQEHAATLLTSIDPASEAREMLDQVPRLVEDMVANFNKSPSVEAYQKILDRFKDEVNPLARHNHQASALAVLVLLSVGGAKADDLSDVGLAGLIHDLGLSKIPSAIVEKHLFGNEELNNSEQLLYLRHTDIIMEIIHDQGIAITPGAKTILEQHHENWDGTGFKTLSGHNIYRPARALRIADDIVAQLNHRKTPMGYRAALNQIASTSVFGESHWHDPEMITKLLKVANEGKVS